jgi:tetratricopeptide (TPR) repeat protein
VANLIGYSYRKLGDYKLSQVWYERALKADPNHVLTWNHYGLWQIEQAPASRRSIILAGSLRSAESTARSIGLWRTRWKSRPAQVSFIEYNRNAIQRAHPRVPRAMSEFGTFETCRPVPLMSVHGGRPEVIGASPNRRV